MLDVKKGKILDVAVDIRRGSPKRYLDNTAWIENIEARYKGINDIYALSLRLLVGTVRLVKAH